MRDNKPQLVKLCGTDHTGPYLTGGPILAEISIVPFLLRLFFSRKGHACFACQTKAYPITGMPDHTPPLQPRRLRHLCYEH
jgi:hypothetical protein